MNTSTWNSVIFMKSSKSMDDMKAMKQWPGVEAMWTTTGPWDWCVKLTKELSTPEQTEEFVARMRQGSWASETQTNWWRAVAE